VVVSSLTALNTALGAVTTAQANAGYRIGLAVGEYAASALAVITQRAALHSATKAVLVRAVTPGTVTFTKGAELDCSNVALAYCTITGSWRIANNGAQKNSTFLRCYGPGSSAFVLSGNGQTACGLVGVVMPDRYSTNGDRLHFDTKSATATPPSDCFITRCWIEGIDDDGTGGHTDTMQWTAMLGTNAAAHTYFGAAGDNGTSQIKPDQQNGFTPFGTFTADTCFFGGDTTAGGGQGNSSSQGGPDIRTNCVFFDPSNGRAYLVNTGGGTPAKVTNSTFIGTINQSLASLSSDSTGNVLLPYDVNYRIPVLDKTSIPWAWW
jgi:hypothetical protein